MFSSHMREKAASDVTALGERGAKYGRIRLGLQVVGQLTLYEATCILK